MDNENNLLAGLALVVVIGLGVLLTGGMASDKPVPIQPVQPSPVVPPPVPTPPPVPHPPPCPNCPRAADDAGCQPVGLGEKCLCCRKCDNYCCQCTPGDRCWDGCRCHEHEFSAGASVDGESHDGAEIQLPLPPDFHTKNVGGTDGAGLCVFCSMHHSGIWADEPVFAHIFDFMKKHRGGGWPQKVDEMVKACAKEMGLPEPEYIQVTGRDLSVLKEACRQGRMPGVTYSFSPTGRYGGRRISHMVSLLHADDHWFVILDNNYVTGEKHLEWMTPDEFLRTYGSGWAVILLKSGPPYPPKN